MNDYTGWTKWLETMYNDLQSITNQMDKETNTHRDNISLRKNYVQKCSEWLVVCDVMRNRIEYAKQRAITQMEKLTTP
jgi:hypothetical protein